MSNVLIVNKGCHDYSKAAEFGDLYFMTEGQIGRFSTGEMYRRFSPYIKESKPDDLILVSGLPIMTTVACSMFAAKHGKVNLLLHNSGPGVREHYVQRTINMEGL